MGKSSSKQVDQTNVKSDEFQSGGVHVLEYHGPSAGYAFLLFLSFAAVAAIAFFAYKKCRKRHVRKALQRAGIPWPAAASGTSPTSRTMESGIPMQAFNYPSSSAATMMMPPSSQLAQAMAAAAMLSARRDQLWSSPQLEEEERWYEFPPEPRRSSGHTKRTSGASRQQRTTFPTTNFTESVAGLHTGSAQHNAVVAATAGPQEPLSTEAAVKMLRAVVDAAGGVPRRAVEKRRRGHAVVPAVVAEDDNDADLRFDTEVGTSA